MNDRTYRFYDNRQGELLPGHISELLPQDHLAFFIDEMVRSFDLGEVHDSYQSADRGGAPPFDPEMMLKVLLYGYATGVFSARKLSKRCAEDVAFIYLAGKQRPDFRTIIGFRARHIAFFEKLFVQVVEYAREAGLAKLGTLAIDGTKVKANASKHKAMSYSRMLEEEKKLKAQVAELLEKAKAVDEAEDAEYGDWDGYSLPEALSHREGRLKAIQEAKGRLEQRAKERAELEKKAREKEAKDRKKAKLPPKEYRSEPDEKPRPSEQENFTDPESRIMLDGATKGFIQAYNGQVAVDSEAKIIVTASLDNNASDRRKLIPLIEQIKETLGEYPESVLADGGYPSEENFKALDALQINGLVACGREVYDPSLRAPRGPIPKNATLTDRMKRKLLTKAGRALYRTRKHVAEPVIGWIKSVLGFRQFSLRGISKVRGEWNLVCLALNLRRLRALAT